MALVRCKECATEISNKATNCPKCGAPAPRKTSAFTWTVVGLFCFWAIGSFLNKSTLTNQQGNTKPAPTPEEVQAGVDRIRAGELVLHLRDSAKDPDSFKLHDAYGTKAGSACVEYSATNSFNARLRGIAVLARGKTTIATDVPTWNRLCTGPTIKHVDYKDLFDTVLLRKRD